MTRFSCRFCSTPLQHVVADLGSSPLANSYRSSDDLHAMEPHFPLVVRVCASCFLVQLPNVERPENIFTDYAYFSSFSESWLQHADRYTHRMRDELSLTSDSSVVEIASNDGYLLQFFSAAGVPVLGIEPAANVAAAAIEKGVPTLVEFFGSALAQRLASEGKKADLLIGNNVLAHVPDLNDFVRGLKILLAPNGTITMEFPHLLNLIALNQFDTIYHEHYSYLSLLTVERVFAAHGLTVTDIDELETHGGSIRIHARHQEENRIVSDRVLAVRRKEADAGLDRVETYTSFDERVRETKRALLTFLIRARREGKRIAAYGAPAKGNTLLNYCGIRSDFIDFTVDRSPHKQGRFLPGSLIPIHAPDRIFELKPDYVLILPWNLRTEIIEQMSGIRSWGGSFVVPIPTTEIIA